LGLRSMWSRGLIKNFVVEIAAHIYENIGITVAQAVEMFGEMEESGYEIFLLIDADYSSEIGSWPLVGASQLGGGSDPIHKIPKGKMDILIQDRLSKRRGTNVWIRYGKTT